MSEEIKFNISPDHEPPEWVNKYKYVYNTNGHPMQWSGNEFPWHMRISGKAHIRRYVLFFTLGLFIGIFIGTML